MAQPVAINASKLANKSGIVKFVTATTTTRAAMSPMAKTPCANRRKSWILVLFGLKVKICMITQENPLRKMKSKY